jgi:hypothetical protein
MIYQFALKIGKKYAVITRDDGPADGGIDGLFQQPVKPLE